MKNSNRRKQRIAALSLAATLLLGGCSSNDSFMLAEDDNGQLISFDDRGLTNESIHYYKVLEVYNKITKNNEIYIVKGSLLTEGEGIYRFVDMFTNMEFFVGDEQSIFEYVKATSLRDYIVSLGLGQTVYTYDDMKRIYEVIKDNYVFEEDSSLKKVRTDNYFL